MQLKPKKRPDRPNTTAYTLTIGSKEAREAGLIGDKGELFDIKKEVLPGLILIRTVGNDRLIEFSRKHM